MAHHLAGHLDVGGVVTFVVQFLAAFWLWTPFTYYAERFESDGLENRLFTFAAIVSVAGLAVFGEDGLGVTYIWACSTSGGVPMRCSPRSSPPSSLR